MNQWSPITNNKFIYANNENKINNVLYCTSHVNIILYNFSKNGSKQK